MTHMDEIETPVGQYDDQVFRVGVADDALRLFKCDRFGVHRSLKGHRVGQFVAGHRRGPFLHDHEACRYVGQPCR